MKCILCLLFFRGLRDELVSSRIIVALCNLCDIIRCTNSLQEYLHGARLHWCDVPKELNNVLQSLQLKAEQPSKPKSSYFGRIEQFIGIAKKSAGGRFKLHSYKSFDVNSFHKGFIKPVIRNLIEEIKNAFDVPELLMGFSVLVPDYLPQDLKQLEEYGKKEIEDLASFYGFPCIISDGKESIPPVLSGPGLIAQYDVFKKVALNNRNMFESTQKADLNKVEEQIVSKKKEIELLKSMLTKTNIEKEKQKIRELEREADTLKHNQIYIFNLLLKDWCTDPALTLAYPDITKLLKLAALIPPSTAEVERSFSLMNLILTPLRKRLLLENLSHCMHICKFPRALSDANYKKILQHWLLGEETKSSSRRVCTRL